MVWYTHAETVTTGVQRLIAYSPRRKSFKIRNRGSQAIYIGPDNGLTTANGYPIEPGASEFFSKELGDEVIYEVYFVGDAASINIRVLERVEGEPRSATE